MAMTRSSTGGRLAQAKVESMKSAIHMLGMEAPRPDERLLIATSLPPHNAMRWTAVRKTRVVTAVLCGVLTLDEARTRYALSLEEFMSWQRLVVRGDAPSRVLTGGLRPRLSRRENASIVPRSP
jgi:Protein of unknown function (DUF1153)